MTYQWSNVPVYLVDCQKCGFELTFRGVTYLPKDSVCVECGQSLEPTGEVAFETLCVYCDHHNFVPKFVRRPRCEKCGFVIHDNSEIVGTTKMVAAGLKTGDRETILMVVVAVVGVLLVLSVMGGWWK